MAKGREERMLLALHALLIAASAVNCVTLRAHWENRGVFTVDANRDPAGGGGGGAALPVAAHGVVAEGGYTARRSRRSSGVSAMPKVYGQVGCARALMRLQTGSCVESLVLRIHVFTAARFCGSSHN